MAHHLHTLKGRPRLLELLLTGVRTSQGMGKFSDSAVKSGVRCFESVDGVFAGGRAPYGHHHQNQSRLSPARPPRPQKCSLLLRPTVLPTKVQPTQSKWLLYSVLPCCHFCSPLSKHYNSFLRYHSCWCTGARLWTAAHPAQELGFNNVSSKPLSCSYHTFS